MNGVAKRLVKNFLAPFILADPTPIEALVTLTMLWWGLALAQIEPFGLAELSYHGLFAVRLPAFAWVLLFVGPALLTILSRLMEWRKLERFMMLASAGLWMFVAGLFFTLSPFGLLTGTCYLRAIGAGWAYWRLRYYE